MVSETAQPLSQDFGADYPGLFPLFTEIRVSQGHHCEPRLQQDHDLKAEKYGKIMETAALKCLGPGICCMYLHLWFMRWALRSCASVPLVRVSFNFH